MPTKRPAAKHRKPQPERKRFPRKQIPEVVSLINAAGGREKFAELMGVLTEEHYRQQISNWKARGIPRLIQIKKHDVILALRAAAQESQAA